MQHASDGSFRIDDVVNNSSVRQVPDFKELLTNYGLTYKADDDFYLQVGEILQVQGWILHLSVVRIQIAGLLELLIPELINRDVPFKIIRDSETAKYILDAGLGYYRLGKIVALYPKERTDIEELAQFLVALTKNFRGPSIPTDRHLGSIVYTRYGSYNPVIKPDSQGNIRYIYNDLFQLIPDEFIIPYIPPANVKWPFGAIVPPVPPPPAKLLNKTYKPLFVIKDDTKGRVLKGIYMKGFLNFKHCIIKEGKKDMWLDEYGRDIQDRLKWQYDLCRDLSNDIPFPEIFDLFESGGDLYLAMEFINGRSLEAIVFSIYKEQSWITLSSESRVLLLNYLIEIARIIQNFHAKGYIHRDITPANFLIDKKNSIFLIDMELSYSIFKKVPDPPFKFGTIGYVSPEQRAFQKPDVPQDIYALGALMAFIFTGLPPTKFSIKESTALLESFFFFTGDHLLSELVVSCLQFDPQQRPSLDAIIQKIDHHQKQEGKDFKRISSVGLCQKGGLNEDTVLHMINSSLQKLKIPDLVTKSLLWDTPVLIRVNNKNGYVEREELPDFFNGMSGIIYCLAKAKKLGYDIEVLLPAYRSSLAFVVKSISCGYIGLQPGLYNGRAGIAIAIAEGLRSGLIPFNDEIEAVLQKCFSGFALSLDYANGVSGQGIALLHCRKWLKRDFVESAFNQYLTIIIDRQLKDGSWNVSNVYEDHDKKQIGFANGVSGVIQFLLAYLHIYPDEKIMGIAKKALNWLQRQGRSKNDTFHWEVKEEPTAFLVSRDYGMPGMALIFIRAYHLFKDSAYKATAENALRFLSSIPVSADLTQVSGLAGLGEIYEEAYDVFNNEEWKNRSDWIAHTFTNLMLTDRSGNSHWTMLINPDPVADLMTGSCGVIHFLMCYISYKQAGPLLHPRDSDN